MIPDFQHHTFPSAALADAVKFSTYEARKRNDGGAKELFDWIQDMKDIGATRNTRRHGKIFAMAKRLLQGDIKDKFERRYFGAKTFVGLQKFLFDEISPRDPGAFYRRHLTALVRKHDQDVESFERVLLNTKLACEIAMESDQLPGHEQV